MGGGQRLFVIDPGGKVKRFTNFDELYRIAGLAPASELRTPIEKRGLTYFRVTGGSRDEKHQEPGWGFSSATPQSAQELSQRFRQLAFFWIENDRLSLIDARTGNSTNQGSWHERWLGPEILP